MAKSTFSGPVVSKNGFHGELVGRVVPLTPVLLPEYTLATLPDAAENTGSMIFVTDAGSGEMAFSNGTDWISVVTGVAVA